MRCACGFESNRPERSSHFINLTRLLNTPSISFEDLFVQNHSYNCTNCNQITNHYESTLYEFPNEMEFLLIRLNNMLMIDNQIIRLNTKITNYDTDNIFVPNQQNLNFKIIAAIAHHGDNAYSGHYVIWVRNQNAWLRISDTQSRYYNNLIKDLNNIYLLVLKKI